jgi:hypothetical protein
MTFKGHFPLNLVYTLAIDRSLLASFSTHFVHIFTFLDNHNMSQKRVQKCKCCSAEAEAEEKPPPKLEPSSEAKQKIQRMSDQTTLFLQHHNGG